MQLTKTIYFQDYQLASGARSGLTIPFAEADRDLFKQISHLSSYRIRELLGFGTYRDLERAANEVASPVSAFARSRLRQQVKAVDGVRSRRETELQSTFRGGKGSPLHDWYPYLEGYSPDFVGAILDTYGPDAGTILDPFCGSGTTALVAASRGALGLYSEVNPVCRYIIEAKALALGLEGSRRMELAEKLYELSGSLRERLQSCKPDAELASNYEASFSGKASFSRDAFLEVLRSRSLVDKIGAADAAFGQFATVAALRSLVPGSLMVRRGDLRFRTESELRRSPPDFLAAFEESCAIIASDLVDADRVSGEITLIANNAKQLSENLSPSVDMVITSPPYLNGTNYFRNTKLELWFLGHLTHARGLRGFRDAAITSGINDVTAKKAIPTRPHDMPDELRSVLIALQESSYDQRIPLMVQSYFQEMAIVIANIAAVLRQGGAVAIDLGDSCYGNVWVPTDRILAKFMEMEGFRQVDHVLLRERQSRDGRKLSQTLQVFRGKDL